MSLSSAATVAVVAMLAPLLTTRSVMPALVLEILLGVLIGPHGLGVASVDEPVAVLAVIGLGFLLLLSGLDLDLFALRGAAVLENAGAARTTLGQVVITASSIAEILPVVALSVLFSGHGRAPGAGIVLLVGFVLLVGAGAAVALRIERWVRLSDALLRLQDTTSEIHVRAALAMLLAYAAAASGFGLEAILGAFLAGVTINLVDRDPDRTHAEYRTKLRAVGYGALVPFFFVSTGMGLDVGALLADRSALALVPLFLLVLLLARATPALLLVRIGIEGRGIAAAGLLQATSLSIPVVAGRIGVELGLLEPRTYLALVTAGLASVVVFPAIALRLLPPEVHLATAGP